ncbi:hypothetical protein [Streptomyces coelicoflavus]|uniref:hypothetical protein n=1 Tax=Streptomyces coelicoflavus TaxID=285562 RepID=UPI00362A50B9
MESSTSPLPPVHAIGDLRGALRAGHGFPGDLNAFEADLRHALESSSTDLTTLASVIVDYRGRIRLHEDPDFDTAVQEGIDLSMRVKREAQNGRAMSSP